MGKNICFLNARYTQTLLLASTKIRLFFISHLPLSLSLYTSVRQLLKKINLKKGGGVNDNKTPYTPLHKLEWHPLVQVNDIITHVNGDCVIEVPHSAAVDALKRAGNSVFLTVKRKKQVLNYRGFFTMQIWAAYNLELDTTCYL